MSFSQPTSSHLTNHFSPGFHPPAPLCDPLSALPSVNIKQLSCNFICCLLNMPSGPPFPWKSSLFFFSKRRGQKCTFSLLHKEDDFVSFYQLGGWGRVCSQEPSCLHLQPTSSAQQLWKLGQVTDFSRPWLLHL